MIIKGVVKDIVYKNEENSYTVFRLDIHGDSTIVTGKFPVITEGEWLELSGKYVMNEKYGVQFVVDSYKVATPSSLEGIVKYLSSGLLPGVGPATAYSMVEKFKGETLDVIRFSPSRLVEIKGISERKAKEISEAYEEVYKMQSSVMLMQQYNISTNLAIKIYRQYGNATENILKTNPYKLVEDVDGIGFFTADKIAQNMGIKPNSEFRLRAGILHVLKANSDQNGNTYMLKSTLISLVTELLKLSDMHVNLTDIMCTILEQLALDTYVKILETEEEEDVIMLGRYYNYEKVLADSLILLNSDAVIKFNVEEDISLYENETKIHLHENQKDAVRMAINNGVSIITGGPGTGKTTIIKCILKILKNMHRRVKLMAPTGRAAKRLSESTGQEASTIHRALEVNFNDSNNMHLFRYNHMNKLDYDAIIVDEVSMVDVQLMYHLVRAIPRGCKLILVGDKDQLASVGAGNVLADLLTSNKIATCMLTQIYRQEENSLIIVNAHAINHGQMPMINNKSKDFFFDEKADSNEALNSIINMCVSRIPKFLGVESSSIQVLAPMKAGVCGIDNINKCLQEKLNPSSLRKAEVEVERKEEKIIYREGDRVMQITNNYDRDWKKENGESGKGVFNGDIGLISSINTETKELFVDFEDGRRAKYAKTDYEELTLSYAITIHKSQGSEFDVVVIPVVSGPPMLLTRNLIYTAVTRAKKMVVLVGTKQCIGRMVSNNYTKVRYTMLKHFLIEDSAIYGADSNESNN